MITKSLNGRFREGTFGDFVVHSFIPGKCDVSNPIVYAYRTATNRYHRAISGSKRSVYRRMRQSLRDRGF